MAVISLVPKPLRGTARTRALPSVDIVIPVRNEEACLEQSVRRVHHEVLHAQTFSARIVVADNGSTDRTAEIGERLSRQLSRVRLHRLDQPGRGRALRSAWMSSNADVVAYMDADLSTDLAALAVVIDAVASGRADVAIGSRLVPGARVRRSLRRELISRCYNLLLRRTLHLRTRDAQCGFKALRTEVAKRLLPQVRDVGWFFDTELLVVAERSGAAVLEVPVTWREDPTSTVRIVPTAIQDLRGIARMRRQEQGGTTPGIVDQVARFVGIGVISTLAYVGIFDGLRDLLPVQVANATALVVTAVANTIANRRYTFGIRGRRGLRRTLVAGVATFAAALALTSAGLAGLDRADAGASTLTADTVLVATSAVATVLRFSVLRSCQKLR